MKTSFCRISLSFIFLFGFHTAIFSQNDELNYTVELNSNISTQETLPFWLTTNKYGAIPNSDNVTLSVGIFQDFKPLLDTNKINFSFGAQLTGAIANENELIVNQLYSSLKWKKLQLDIGVKHKEVIFEGLSSTNGDFTFSTNARSIPGINLKLIDYVKLPFAKKWLTVKGNFGEYLLNDNRVVNNAHIHHKSLYFKSQLNESLELITGISHYAMWSGNSNDLGQQPSGFSNYIKAIFGKAGDESSSENDQINVLGNHLGNYLIRLNKSGEKMDWSFYWSHPFEDRSGIEFKNLPDATYGLFFDLLKPEALISHINVEYTFTKDQGRILSSSNLIDNYFNNTIYNSGWTYNRRVIGSPFFIPKESDENGFTRGVSLDYSRFSAFHIGIKGLLFHKIKYTSKMSYLTYYGKYNSEFVDKPKQLKSYFEFQVPTNKIPFDINIGTAFDISNTIKNNFGGFIRISKTGEF